MEILRILAEDGAGKEALKHTVEGLPQESLSIGGILNYVYAAMGLIAVAGIIFGAVSWITSAGDPGKAKKGRDAIIYGIAGLLIVLFAVAISNLIIGSLAGSGGSG